LGDEGLRFLDRLYRLSLFFGFLNVNSHLQGLQRIFVDRLLLIQILDGFLESGGSLIDHSSFYGGGRL